MLLTNLQVDGVLVHMGYGRVVDSYLLNLLSQTNFEPYQSVLVDSLVAELNVVKASYQQARADSMAEKVGDLTVNYSQHIGFLKTEGKRLEKLLAELVGIPSYISYWGSAKGSSKAVSFIGYG